MTAARLRIAAETDGWRRAGRVWGRAPQDVDAGALTEAERAMLLAAPRLTVEALSDDAQPDPPVVIDALADAIRGLPPEAFAQDGKPRVDALSAAVNARVTATERDAAWAAFEASAATEG